MAKIKVTTRFRILDFIDGFVDDTTANAIGQTVVDGAKELIASGQSPVRGYGRFEEYKEAGRRKVALKKIAQDAKGLRAQAKKAELPRLAKLASLVAARKRNDVTSSVLGYPYNVMKQYPGKMVRPVNLYLSGDMLDYYDYVVRDSSIFVGVQGNSHAAEIAGYHNDGTDKMAQRKLVPGDGEEWAVSIMRDIRDLYGARLAEIIRQSNK